MFSIVEQLQGFTPAKPTSVAKKPGSKHCRLSGRELDLLILATLAEDPGLTDEEIYPLVGINLHAVRESLRRMRRANRVIAVQRTRHVKTRYWPVNMQDAADEHARSVVKGGREEQLIQLMSDKKWRSNVDVQLATGWCSQDISVKLNFLLLQGKVTYRTEKGKLGRRKKMWRAV